MSDIIKYLTFKITADDLSPGTWDALSNGVKMVKNNITELNRAWEFGAKVYQTAMAALQTPIEMLSKGGEFAEAQAGFEALASNAGISSRMILDHVRDITEGTIGIAEATKMTSAAIARGYSYEQIGVVFELAKKWSDTVGGSIQENAEKIEKGLFGGRAAANLNKEFGLTIEKADTMAEKFDKVRAKLDSMGKGAFNFSDSWIAIVNSIKDAEIMIDKGFNQLAGENGFANFSKSVREEMRSVERLTGEIATGIFIPLKDGIGALALSLADIGDVFGVGFGKADTLGTKVLTIITTVGNSLYDLGVLAGGVWNIFSFPIDEISKMLATLASAGGSVTAFAANKMGIDVGGLQDLAKTMDEVANSGLLRIDLDAIRAKKTAYNDAILSSGEAFKKTTKDAGDHKKALDEVGVSQKEVEKRAKDHAKSLEDLIKANENYNGKVEQINKDYHAKVENREKEHQKQIADFVKDSNQKRIDMQKDLGDKMYDISVSAQRKIEDAFLDHGGKLDELNKEWSKKKLTGYTLQEEEEYKKKVAEEVKGFNEDAKKAELDRARAAQDASTAYSRKRDSEEQASQRKAEELLAKQADQDVKDNADYVRKIEDADSDYRKKASAAWEEYQKTGDRAAYEKKITSASKKKESADGGVRKLEIDLPENPNVLEALVTAIIDGLKKAAKGEGVKVQA